MSRLRCTRCFSIVAPAEATCGGCGASFTPKEIEQALELRPENRDKICGECGPDECARESA